MQTSANIQTETQINGCLLYAIPCAYFCVCVSSCGGCWACMKWCALNMNEGRRQLNCFCDEYWLHFPWTNNPRGVRGSLLFYCYFAFLLLWALHLLLCVCVPSVRGADTTDRSRRMCMRWSLVCRSCLLLPLPSVCCCCGRAVCACACCRGLECVSCVVCGVRCMPGCCPLLMLSALSRCIRCAPSLSLLFHSFSSVSPIS
ncbi:hypothetical protein Tc00.1047053510015.10 [Trypanosoma cruzi]|uniref:Mucin TcMUC n=1 Tax=Trypanosoma cruzi (strain CL Brener) TaxID=353153 RepID=Q4CVP0_TRYCC|nr:hypothetical protein Tc00.1047053510015.10 [Trypanosoma cruzi]EAN84339.1 hypothetical protein Tc00.1047053510015.10 [Trypanosoma cruzi]|eukprot:XP_806190.1 hypothetical protein [Trypanosoma cruzi strain CL Brener]